MKDRSPRGLDVSMAFSANLSARAAIDQLSGMPVVIDNNLLPLLTWFPSFEQHKELERADASTRAAKTAEFLGHITTWFDNTRAAQIPQIEAINYNLDNYIKQLIRSLNGDINLVAQHIHTVGQAAGLHMVILDTLGGNLEKFNIKENGELLTQDESLNVLLEESQRDTRVQAGRYNPEEQEFSFELI